MSGIAIRGLGTAIVYHRVRTRIQTVALDNIMIASGEVCGHAPWGSQLPAVQAYWGPLQRNDSGIEFETVIAPTPGSSTPSMAYWYGGTDGVVSRANGLVCIPVSVRRSVP